MFSNVRLSTKRSTLGMLSGPKDLIPLQHFGLKETKAKVDLMEDLYDHPMEFDPELIPDLAVQARMLVLGVRVSPCMGLLEDTSDLIQCLHSWLVCMGSSARRRCRIQSSISSPWQLPVRAGRLMTHSYFNLFTATRPTAFHL